MASRESKGGLGNWKMRLVACGDESEPTRVPDHCMFPSDGDSSSSSLLP